MRIPIRVFVLIGMLGIAYPMFADDEPTLEGKGEPVFQQSKQLWAHSYLWAKSPEFVVEKWLSEEPDMSDKFILIEYWSTWCSSCRRAQPLMNRLHERFGDELVIIGISDEQEDKVRQYMKKEEIQYHMAIDTQKRMKDELGIYGIPHVIIVEPGGYIIWEGFPLLEGYELTEETVEKILAIGRAKKS